jgi:hypothetical protein
VEPAPYLEALLCERKVLSIKHTQELVDHGLRPEARAGITELYIARVQDCVEGSARHSLADRKR